MIADKLGQVQGRIASACAAASRPVQSVTLLAVSKTFAAGAVREALVAGQCRFGENYVQEGVDKIAALADVRGQIEWHLIGPLQSNKTRIVAEQFDWVQSIDRLKIAERLSAQRPPGRGPLSICVQVNISGEATKHGVSPGEAAALAHAVAVLPNLRLRGLMAVPETAGNDAAARRPHRALHELFLALRGAGLDLDTLSTGMSADLEAAIAEGSTMVRVGTALFGGRPSPG